MRLYSLKSFKSLGTLDYHKGALQGLAFANPCPDTTAADDDDAEERARRARWLASGGVDKPVVLWELMDFENPPRTARA